MNDQTIQGWQGTNSDTVEKLIEERDQAHVMLADLGPRYARVTNERDLYEKALRNIASGEIPDALEYARGVLGASYE